MKNLFSFAIVRGLVSALLVGWLLAAVPAFSATVWDGPVMSFSESTTDPTQPINQDRMTDRVWITRAATGGIFNAVTETFFTHNSSPADTEWANGNLSDYASLTYTDWNSWAKGVNPSPPSTVGVNAVMHLKTDDIYVGIKFTAWGARGSGLFAYQRTTPRVNAPPAPIPLGISKIGTNVVLTWTNAAFGLQAGTTVTNFTTIAGATSPYTNSTASAALFFRLIH